MKTKSFSLLHFFLAAMPLGLFFGVVLLDLMQILRPYSYLVYWAIYLHVTALGFSFLLSVPKILRYMSTLPSYNQKKTKISMSFEEVVCIVAVSIFAVIFLFRWENLLPIRALIWPESFALFLMLMANKRRIAFLVHLCKSSVHNLLSNTTDAFLEPPQNEAV